MASFAESQSVFMLTYVVAGSEKIQNSGEVIYGLFLNNHQFITCGEGYIENPNLAFFPYSIDNLSIRSDPKPDPVPPPKE